MESQIRDINVNVKAIIITASRCCAWLLLTKKSVGMTDWRMFSPCWSSITKAISQKDRGSPLTHIHPTLRVLTTDSWNPSYGTLARYNSGMRFQPFLSNPVRYTPPCTITAKLGGTPVKPNSPPYLIYWIIGIKLPHLCARRPLPPETMAKPALQFPAPMDVGRWILWELDEEICARS